LDISRRFDLLFDGMKHALVENGGSTNLTTWFDSLPVTRLSFMSTILDKKLGTVY